MIDAGDPGRAVEAVLFASEAPLSVEEIRALGNAEVVEWMAFFAYRRAMEEVERNGH